MHALGALGPLGAAPHHHAKVPRWCRFPTGLGLNLAKPLGGVGAPSGFAQTS